MSEPESPALTDAEQLKAELAAQAARMDRLVAAVNGIGENMAWLVSSTQGIFAFFSDPAAVSRLMSGMPPEMTGAPQ